MAIRNVWNDSTKITNIPITTLSYLHRRAIPRNGTANGGGAERRPSKQHARVYRAPAADLPGRGRARAPRKPPPRPGGFGFQRAQHGNVARRTMTIPVYGGNQGNGIGHAAAAVHTRNSHSARTPRTHVWYNSDVSVQAHTRAHTRHLPPSWNIIIYYYCCYFGRRRQRR